MKREDVLTWDEYFMGLAHLSAKRSPMPLICRYQEKLIRQYDKKVQAIIGPAFLV